MQHNPQENLKEFHRDLHKYSQLINIFKNKTKASNLIKIMLHSNNKRKKMLFIVLYLKETYICLLLYVGIMQILIQIGGYTSRIKRFGNKSVKLGKNLIWDPSFKIIHNYEYNLRVLFTVLFRKY
jgi:hypothetical protein